MDVVALMAQDFWDVMLSNWADSSWHFENL
jgi:hypothetical protein